jgi:hypothetical protein
MGWWTAIRSVNAADGGERCEAGVCALTARWFVACAGAGNFFWAFPSKATQLVRDYPPPRSLSLLSHPLRSDIRPPLFVFAQRKNKIESTTKQLAELKERQTGTSETTLSLTAVKRSSVYTFRRRTALEEKKAKAMEGRQPSAARDAKLARIQELRKKQAEIAAEMQKYSATDPERIKELRTSSAALRCMLGRSIVAFHALVLCRETNEAVQRSRLAMEWYVRLLSSLTSACCMRGPWEGLTALAVLR